MHTRIGVRIQHPGPTDRPAKVSPIRRTKPKITSCQRRGQSSTHHSLISPSVLSLRTTSDRPCPAQQPRRVVLRRRRRLTAGQRGAPCARLRAVWNAPPPRRDFPFSKSCLVHHRCAGMQRTMPTAATRASPAHAETARDACSCACAPLASGHQPVLDFERNAAGI